MGEGPAATAGVGEWGDRAWPGRARTEAARFGVRRLGLASEDQAHLKHPLLGMVLGHNKAKSGF